jgi:hypothetical protein
MKISATKETQCEDHSTPLMALGNITEEDMLLHLAHLLRCDVCIRALRGMIHFTVCRLSDHTSLPGARSTV